jgi:hypothetical protein
MKILPDAFLEVRFKTPEEGGRSTSIRGDFYACPLFVDGEGFECRLLIKDVTLELGQCYELPVKFMNKGLVLPKLFVGKTVTLWEGKDVGTGKVMRIA